MYIFIVTWRLVFEGSYQLRFLGVSECPKPGKPYVASLSAIYCHNSRISADKIWVFYCICQPKNLGTKISFWTGGFLFAIIF